MVWRGPLLLLALLLLLLSGVRAQECTTEADCPQNTATPFCSGAFCISGYCVAKPPPCSTSCSETLKACVGCETNSDCIGNPQGTICDPNQHICRPCFDSFDCPEGDYCHGGQWDCFNQRCVPPSPMRYPCTDVRQCHEASHTCTGCVTDEQCGVYDFCENNKRCNTTSGQCAGINGNRVCDGLHMYCNSQQARCIQCRTSTDCRLLDLSFCHPILVCSRTDNICRPTFGPEYDIPISPPCNQGDQIETCDEERKLCLPRLCNTDDECQDGNQCNGRERCFSGTCVRPAFNRRSCPDGQHCSDGQTCAIQCLSLSDCAELAYVCKNRDTGVDGIKALCVPCRNDAECQNGVAEDGFETCDVTSGQCQAGISPCRGAPPGSVYDPRTGLCAAPRPIAEQNVLPSPIVEAVPLTGTTAVVDDVIGQVSGFPWIKFIVTIMSVAAVATLLVIITSPLWAASKWQLWRRSKRPDAGQVPFSDQGEEEEEVPVASATQLFTRTGRDPIDNW